jgi:hypothetical protein
MSFLPQRPLLPPASEQAVELFSIQCTTCRVRLKVKDESIIGDILACPKCGSMVHVTPPDGWRQGAAAASIADSAVLSAKPGTPPAIPASPVPPAVAGALAPPALPVQTPEAMPVEHVPAEAALTLEGSVAPHRVAAASRLRADWMLWAGGLGAGIVVGATVWLLAGSRASVSEPPAAAPAPREVAKSPDTPVAPQPAVATPPQPTPENPSVENSEAATVAATDGISPNANAPAEPAATVAAAPADSTNEKTSDPVAVTPPAEPREPAIKLEPAGAGQDLGAPAATSEPAEPYPATEPAAAPADDGAKKATEPATALSESDIQARMATGLTEVRFAQVPLIQFVQFVGDCTALRIAVDDAALAKANIPRTAPITVHLRDTTAGDALKAVLEPLGLTCVARGTTLVVTVAEPGAAK